MTHTSEKKHKLKGLSRKHTKSDYDFMKLCSLCCVLLIMAVIAIIVAIFVKKN